MAAACDFGVLGDEIVLRLSFVSNFGVGVDSSVADDDDDRDELFGLRPDEERLLLVSDLLSTLASNDVRFGLIS